MLEKRNSILNMILYKPRNTKTGFLFLMKDALSKHSSMITGMP